jgi:adenylate kinase family enzyme
MRKPLIVLVTGAPGSGKTTLARAISQELYIPHVNADSLMAGLNMTMNGHESQDKTFYKTIIPILQSYLQNNVSFVLDHVLQNDTAEKYILDELTPFAKIVFIHTLSSNPISRHLSRELARTDRGLVRKNLKKSNFQKKADFHAENLAKTEVPASYEKPVLVVKTDDKYEPDLEKICDFIEAEYEKEEK